MALAPSPAVVRATRLLHYLALHPTTPRTVSQLAREVGLPRATCDTLLQGLAEGGFVRRDEALRYELGPACIVIGEAAREANPALKAAAQHAEALARTTSSVTALALCDQEEVRVSSIFDYGPPLGFRVRRGDAMPLVAPFGAVFVAWAADEAIARWLARAVPPLSRAEGNTYRTALATIRERGFSLTLVTSRQPRLMTALRRATEATGGAPEALRQRDEAGFRMSHTHYLPAQVNLTGTVRLAQVSAPVFLPDGRVGTSLMLLGPAHDVTAADAVALGNQVAAAANTASKEVGGSPPEIRQ